MPAIQSVILGQFRLARVLPITNRIVFVIPKTFAVAPVIKEGQGNAVTALMPETIAQANGAKVCGNMYAVAMFKWKTLIISERIK
jgi:hypothetical protein